MKKNKMMRLASVLLVLVMLTTCVISGTFAKYVTGDNGSDSARVAKWGVTIKVEAEDAFDVSYEAEDPSKTATPSVKAATDVNVLAPGTGKELANAEITGTPEVVFDVAVVCDLELNGWSVNSAIYCPVEFTITANDGTPVTIKFDAGAYADIDAFEEAVEDAVIKALYKNATPAIEASDSAIGRKGLYQYKANDDCAGKVKIDWSWAYSTSEDNDKLDTALGDLAVAPTISFNLAITATQQD